MGLCYHLKYFIKETLFFSIREAQSCVFAGSFFFLLIASNYISLFGLARYDFLFVACMMIQLLLFLFKLETLEEVGVIFLFHIVGLVLELYKTNPAIGSWSYPEHAFFRIGTVPLYSGFMYAAVGSYISQAWNYLRLRLAHAPYYGVSVFLAVAIYVNFFTDHYLPDFRYLLIPLVFALYWNTKVYFTVTTKEYAMPLTLSFGLIAFFIWIAENISTYYGAWKYPNQLHVWNVVGTEKITSWFLLVIISFIIVSYLKHFKRIDA